MHLLRRVLSFVGCARSFSFYGSSNQTNYTIVRGLLHLFTSSKISRQVWLFRFSRFFLALQRNGSCLFSSNSSACKATKFAASSTASHLSGLHPQSWAISFARWRISLMRVSRLSLCLSTALYSLEARSSSSLLLSSDSEDGSRGAGSGSVWGGKFRSKSGLFDELVPPLPFSPKERGTPSMVERIKSIKSTNRKHRGHQVKAQVPRPWLINNRAKDLKKQIK